MYTTLGFVSLLFANGDTARPGGLLARLLPRFLVHINTVSNLCYMKRYGVDLQTLETPAIWTTGKGLALKKLVVTASASHVV